MFGGESFGSQAFGAAIDESMIVACPPGINIDDLCTTADLVGQSVDDLCECMT